VERMTLNPFAAVEQPPQIPQRPFHSHTEDLLQRMNGAHLVGHGTDAADPRHDVRHLVVMPADQQGLEEPRRLKDSQLDVLHKAVFHGDMERAFAFDARNQVDRDGSRVGFF